MQENGFEHIRGQRPQALALRRQGSSGRREPLCWRQEAALPLRVHRRSGGESTLHNVGHLSACCVDAGV